MKNNNVFKEMKQIVKNALNEYAELVMQMETNHPEHMAYVDDFTCMY